MVALRKEMSVLLIPFGKSLIRRVKRSRGAYRIVTTYVVTVYVTGSSEKAT